MKDDFFDKTFNRCINYAIPVWIAVIAVFVLIFSTLRNGVSCDEGFYLMGYLRNQPINFPACDFHYIVRALTTCFPDDDVMVFRYLRLFLYVIAIVMFSIASYKWVKCFFKLSVPYYRYSAFIFLASSWSYTFAAPTISYDHIQTILFLFVFSFYCLRSVAQRPFVKIVASMCIGFFLWFAFANSVPSASSLVVLR